VIGWVTCNLNLDCQPQERDIAALSHHHPAWTIRCHKEAGQRAKACTYAMPQGQASCPAAMAGSAAYTFLTNCCELRLCHPGHRSPVAVLPA
jgi:hypothetical protein